MDNDTKRYLLSNLVNLKEFEEIAKEAFNCADKDHNGFIDLFELELCMNQVANGFGFEYPKKDIIKNEFKRLDTDKNGKIDFDEFKKFVKETMRDIIICM